MLQYTFTHLKHVPHIHIHTRTCTHASPMCVSGYWCTDYTNDKEQWENQNGITLTHHIRIHIYSSYCSKSQSCTQNTGSQTQGVIHNRECHSVWYTISIMKYTVHWVKMANKPCPPQYTAPKPCHAFLKQCHHAHNGASMETVWNFAADTQVHWSDNPFPASQWSQLITVLLYTTRS